MSILQALREKKQIRYLALASALRGIRDNLRFVTWQPFALSLGITMRSIGALESLMDFAKIIIQPVMGAASDVYGRKSFILLREAVMLAACLCFLLARSWQLLAAGMILVGFGFALLPVWQSLVAEGAPPRETGMFFSIIGSSYMAAGLLGTLLGGWLASNIGYRFVYGISTFFAFTALVLTFYKIEETHYPEGPKNFTLLKALKSFLDTFRPPKYLWGFYIAMAVDLLVFSTGWRLINGMLTEAYGYTPFMLGIMTSVNGASMAVFQIILGKYVDKVGYVRYLAISQILSCFLIGLLLLNQSFPVAIISNFIMGLAAALWGPAEQAWISINVESGERAKGIGGYSTFRGIVALPGPFIGGILYDNFGYYLPLLINLVGAAIDVGLLLFLVKDRVKPNPPSQVLG
jgi:MFS family permease